MDAAFTRTRYEMDLDDLEMDVDFGFAGGAGPSSIAGRAGWACSWSGSVWQFHEREGVASAVVDHSMLDAGARIPLR